MIIVAWVGILARWAVIALVVYVLVGCAPRTYQALPARTCWALGGDVGQSTEYRSAHGPWWLVRTSCSFPATEATR